MPGEDPSPVIQEIRDYAEQVLLPPMKAIHEKTEINVITEVSVAALDDRIAERASNFVAEVTGRNSRGVVSFGTDAGYFSDAEFSTVVCGPGTITRAHAPDEYIELAKISQEIDFINKIARKLSQ